MMEESLRHISVAPTFEKPDEVAYAVGMLCEEQVRWMKGIIYMSMGGYY